MKRGLVISLILMLSLSFVSASLFGDFWGKISGKAVGEENACEQQGYTCGKPHGSGPGVSCINIGMGWVGDSNLDLSCDSSELLVVVKRKKKRLLFQ